MKMKTPSLFDETPPELQPDEQDDVSDLDEWQEVPQERFLSWSAAGQFGYCRKRDLDSALRADNNEDAAFFLERAAMYERLINDSVQ